MMAILETPSGEIEVRLEKTGPNFTEPTYFDEYVQAGVREDQKATTITRYIVPEDTTYAVEIVVKKGYNFGSEYHRIGVRADDVASGEALFNRSCLVKDLGSCFGHVLLADCEEVIIIVIFILPLVDPLITTITLNTRAAVRRVL